MHKDECESKCYIKGIRQTYWCGLPKKHAPKDHKEHDWLYKNQWYHCYG